MPHALRALALLSCITPAFAAPPADRAEVIRRTRALEADPERPAAEQERADLLAWWTEVPDLTLNVCVTVFLDPDVATQERHKDVSGLLVVHGMLGAGVAILEDGRVEDQPLPLHLAGLEAALGVYTTVRDADPSRKHPFAEKLLKRRDKGKLEAWVERTLRDCG